MEELAVTKKVLDIKVTDKRLSPDEVVAQAFSFIVGGFFTSADILAHCGYELALNAHIERKLYDEIIGAAVDGDIPYDQLSQLPYLDAFLSEIMRHHASPLPLSRYPVTDCKLSGTDIVVRAGTQIEIPLYAIHHSDEFYESPWKFDPDRFMPENKHQIRPYTFLPFGAGPRNCIGMRFALLVIKLALAHIIRRYRLYRTDDTDVPLQYKRKYNATRPKQVIVGIERRPD